MKKTGLKLNIQQMKIMAYGPITSWQIGGKTVTDIILLVSKITADGQPRQHIKKQRHYFGNKGSYSQNYGFSSSQVWMWELDRKEGWVPKNWCFWIVALEKTLETPWTARKSSQSILEEVNPDYSLEGPILKLKLQYFGHLMGRAV